MMTISRTISTVVGNFLYRLVGATLLDGSVYEDVEADRHAGPQAHAVGFGEPRARRRVEWDIRVSR